MKKILIVAALMLGFAVAAVAQPRALGIRGGYGVELSYQHALGSNFIEADLGLNTFNALNVAATYNFSIAQFGGGFNFYAGPGAAVGIGFGEASHFNVGLAAQVGLEYIFNFPLQLSLDLRPQLGVAIVNEGVGLGFWGWFPCLGIRYAF